MSSSLESGDQKKTLKCKQVNISAFQWIQNWPKVLKNIPTM